MSKLKDYLGKRLLENLGELYIFPERRYRQKTKPSAANQIKIKQQGTLESEIVWQWLKRTSKNNQLYHQDTIWMQNGMLVLIWVFAVLLTFH